MYERNVWPERVRNSSIFCLQKSITIFLCCANFVRLCKTNLLNLSRRCANDDHVLNTWCFADSSLLIVWSLPKWNVLLRFLVLLCVCVCVRMLQNCIFKAILSDVIAAFINGTNHKTKKKLSVRSARLYVTVSSSFKIRCCLLDRLDISPIKLFIFLPSLVVVCGATHAICIVYQDNNNEMLCIHCSIPPHVYGVKAVSHDCRDASIFNANCESTSANCELDQLVCVNRIASTKIGPIVWYDQIENVSIHRANFWRNA